MIRERKTYRINSLLQLSDYKATGMETMDQCLMRYVKQGRITREEAHFRANDKATFGDVLDERRRGSTSTVTLRR